MCSFARNVSMRIHLLLSPDCLSYMFEKLAKIQEKFQEKSPFSKILQKFPRSMARLKAISCVVSLSVDRNFQIANYKQPSVKT